MGLQPDVRIINKGSGTCQFGAIPLFLQIGQQLLPMITLNLDDTVLQGTTSTTELLKTARHLFQFIFAQRQAPDQGNPFAFTPFSLPTNSNYTIPAYLLFTQFPATTGHCWLSASRAQASLISGINGSGIAHDVPCTLWLVAIIP
jgi:hypothetical protein